MPQSRAVFLILSLLFPGISQPELTSELSSWSRGRARSDQPIGPLSSLTPKPLILSSE